MESPIRPRLRHALRIFHECHPSRGPKGGVPRATALASFSEQFGSRHCEILNMRKILRSMTVLLFICGAILGALPTLLVIAMHRSAPYDNHNFFLGILIYLVAIVPINIENAKIRDPSHLMKIDTILELALIYNSIIGGTFFGVCGLISDITKRKKQIGPGDSPKF